MSFNKKSLALAIAGLLPSASYAVVDLNAVPGTITYPTFVQETAVPGVNLQNGATPILDVTTQLGFSIVGSSKYIRLDFPGTKLAAGLTPANFSTTGGTPGTLTISAGGAAGESFVVIEVAGASLAYGDHFNFNLLTTQITPDSKTAHAISYRLFDTATQAANANAPGVLPLAAYNGTWYTFGQALTLSCAPLGSTKIDVTNPKKFTDGTLATDLFSVTALVGANVYTNTGTAVTVDQYLPAGSLFVASGHVQDILGTGNLTLNGTASTATPTTATWMVPTYVAPTSTLYNAAIVHLTSDGTLNLLPGNYSLKVTPAAGALSTAPVDLGTCGSLALSGSSDRVDLVWTPGQTTQEWVRVTNPSNTSGAVTVSVWSDDGKRVDFPLSAVKVGTAGVPLPAVLNAQSSTPIININQFYLAARNVDSTFTVGKGIDGVAGKLRIEVRGAFGDDVVDGVRTGGNILGKPAALRLKDGIYIQAVTNASAIQAH